MESRWIADALLALHGFFILFVVAGGLLVAGVNGIVYYLVWRRRR